MGIYVYMNIYTYKHEGEMLRMKGCKKIYKYKKQNLGLTVKDNSIHSKDRTIYHTVTDSASRFSSTPNICLKDLLLGDLLNSSDLISQLINHPLQFQPESSLKSEYRSKKE